METAMNDRKPDTNEMLIIHRFFRREFTLLPTLVAGVRAGDAGRAGVIVAHALDLLDTLHVHHSGEDELLWPLLTARAPLNQDAVQRMEDQHEEVAGSIGRVRELLAAWAKTADPDQAAKLTDALRIMIAALLAHLNEEETVILPIVGGHISAAEWAKLGEHGVNHTPRSKLLIQLGLILEDATADERRHMMAHLPPPVRLLWTTVGQRRYRRHVGRVRGTTGRLDGRLASVSGGLGPGPG
jgi:iron-sulfur cluster repair protein YtfE (RIC family)